MVRVEAPCLTLAVTAGLEVPHFRVVEFGRHPALLIECFHVQGVQGRHHMLSMQTLLGADDWYHLGYADLADLVRRLSDRPEVDLPALYRQMVFNAFIGNTDDHLKNFCLLHRGDAWRLSPAYDRFARRSLRAQQVVDAIVIMDWYDPIREPAPDPTSGPSPLSRTHFIPSRVVCVLGVCE